MQRGSSDSSEAATSTNSKKRRKKKKPGSHGDGREAQRTRLASSAGEDGSPEPSDSSTSSSDSDAVANRSASGPMPPRLTTAITSKQVEAMLDEDVKATVREVSHSSICRLCAVKGDIGKALLLSTRHASDARVFSCVLADLEDVVHCEPCLINNGWQGRECLAISDG